MLTNFKTTLTDKKHLVNNTYLFNFKLEEPSLINFSAGQYVMLKVPKDGSFVSRLYSIASPSTVTDSFELLIEIIPNGLGSTFLDKKQPGDQVEFSGPAGLFTLKNNNRTKIFLVTGTGIAPVRSILNSGGNILSSNYFVFWGNKNYKDIYLFEELKKFNLMICLSREINLDTVPGADRNRFAIGHVDSCFEKQYATMNPETLADTDFYLCGARQNVESLRLFLLGKKIPLENIHFEKF